MKGPSLLKMTSALKNRTRGINAHNTAHAKHDRGQGPDPHADDMPKESDPVKYKKYSPLKEDESKDSEDKNKDKDKGKKEEDEEEDKEVKESLISLRKLIAQEIKNL